MIADSQGGSIGRNPTRWNPATKQTVETNRELLGEPKVHIQRRAEPSSATQMSPNSCLSQEGAALERSKRVGSQWSSEVLCTSVQANTGEGRHKETGGDWKGELKWGKPGRNTPPHARSELRRRNVTLRTTCKLGFDTNLGSLKRHLKSHRTFEVRRQHHLRCH